MKILKIFGVVVGIHVVALLVIFASPGCNSTAKPTPAPSDTVAKAEPAPKLSVPLTPAAPAPAPADRTPPISAAPVSFNPDAPAVSGGATSAGTVRYSPTRPNNAAAEKLVDQPPVEVTPATTYVVKSGDNLWTLGKKFNLSAAQLAAANNLKTSSVIQPGQKLLIPSKAPTAGSPIPAPAATKNSAAPAAPKGNGEAMKHTVKAGESISTIASLYGVKQRDIEVANNITDPRKLGAGKVLIIPGWSPKSGGAAAPKNAGKSAAPATDAAPKPAKPATPIIPIFGAPADAGPAPVSPAPAPNNADIPVIKIDDAPPAKKP
ncbi:MAG: hypothetical protein RLZZ15_116 [Verrucomicrobiota bacterium]|jgi:LysM repeat protein